MRSKEVDEAIKSCNLLLMGDITLHIIDDDGGTAYVGIVNKQYNDDLETVLNYISELEDDNNELRKYYASRKEVEKLKDIIDALHETGENFISKDKIRDKIKELDKEEQELQNSISEEEREEYSDANISFLLCDIETKRKVLKELLEGE